MQDYDQRAMIIDRRQSERRALNSETDGKYVLGRIWKYAEIGL